MPQLPADLATLPVLLGALVGGVVLLVASVAAIRRAAAGAPPIARLPLAPTQDVRIDVVGPLVLHGEGPHLTRRFGGLAFRLVDRTTRERLPERRLLVRSHASGWSRVRVGLVRFDVARAGVYRLEVDGLAPAPDDAGHALVLAPPGGARLPIAIVAAIAASALAVGSSVAIGWRVLGTSDEGEVARVRRSADATVERTGSADIAPAAAPDRPTPDDPTSAPAAPEMSGGRRLRPGADDAGPKRAVHWAGAGLTLDLPVAFDVRAEGEELDVRDPTRPSTYLVGHVVTFPPPTTAATLAAVARQSAAERLAAGRVEGFESVRFGGVAGVVTIEGRGDGASRMAIWTAYRPAAAGVRDVTVIFGADAATFERLEATIRGVVATARFD